MHLVDIGFDLILIVPLLPPSSLSLDVGYLSSVGFSTLLSVVVQYLVAILELLQEEMSTYPSTPPSCTETECLFLMSIMLHFDLNEVILK